MNNFSSLSLISWGLPYSCKNHWLGLMEKLEETPIFSGISCHFLFEIQLSSWMITRPFSGTLWNMPSATQKKKKTHCSMTLQPSSSPDLVGFICCKTSKERCHWDFWSSSVALQPGKFGVFFRKNDETCGENHQNMDKSQENHQLLFQIFWCVARFFLDYFLLKIMRNTTSNMRIFQGLVLFATSHGIYSNPQEDRRALYNDHYFSKILLLYFLGITIPSGNLIVTV